MYTLYGIPNCDSVKKARVWLDKHSIPYQFHDYKQLGITKAKLHSWCKQLGWENVFNKNSTTFKELPDTERDALNSESAAIDMMIKYNSIIKRPIIEQDDQIVVVRFNEAIYQKTFL